MRGIELTQVSKENLKEALEQIRKDIASLQRDLAGAEGNRATWIFIIMWLVLAHILQSFFHAGDWTALGLAGVLVSGYRFVDGLRIRQRAFRMLKEPLAPMWDTRIDL